MNATTKHTEAPSRYELPDGWYIMVVHSNIMESVVNLYDPNDALLLTGAMMEPELFAAAMNRPASPQQAPVRSVEEAARENIEKIGDPEESFDYMAEQAAAIIQRAIDAAKPDAGLREAAKRLSDEWDINVEQKAKDAVTEEFVFALIALGRAMEGK